MRSLTLISFYSTLTKPIKMSIIVGDLRHKIKVFKLESVLDDYGSSSDSFVLFLTLKAAVKDISGQRMIDLKEKFNSKTVELITYYRPVTESMQIEIEGRRYRILFISEIGTKEGLKITAELINN